jgi:hypothetical protein
MILTADIAPDLADGVIVLRLHGLLSVQSAPSARAVLLKCLAQCPDAVIVDLADLRVECRSQLTVFPAAVRTHSGPPVAILLCGASAELDAMMGGAVLGQIPTAPDCAAAMAAVAAARVVGAPRKVIRLPPGPTAPSRARELVAEACRDWAIEHLRGSASLVVSELVSNAVQHAGTDILLRIARRGDYLHLSVQDGSTEPPRVAGGDRGDTGQLAERGRGLHLVDVYATAWGSNITDGGKTVWATLRAAPLPGRPTTDAPVNRGAG